jgi:hypothetical protein
MYSEKFINDFVAMTFPVVESGKMTDDQYNKTLDHIKTAVSYHVTNDYLGLANVGFGVATASGYGDGGYSCYVARDKTGKIVAARIVFISEEDNLDES